MRMGNSRRMLSQAMKNPSAEENFVLRPLATATAGRRDGQSALRQYASFIMQFKCSSLSLYVGCDGASACPLCIPFGPEIAFTCCITPVSDLKALSLPVPC